MFQVDLITRKGNLILLILALSATIFEKSHEKSHGKYSNSLAYRKYFLKLILSIGFQFWEPPRGALHWSNLDFFIWTPLPNTLVTI